jgi:TolB-like protein/Flp pilus assembly protein TadD
MSDVTQRSGSPIEPDGVPPLPDSVRAELERILASKLFVKSERLGDFLRFVVDRAIQGEADRIKEWVIGVEAFGRAESFDPRVDPAVRIAARQLRYKLREYYATDGKENPIEIDLPKGSYTPIFRSRPVSAGLPRRGTRWKSVALGCIALIVALAAYLIWSRPDRETSRRANTSIAVLPLTNLSNDPEQEFLADGLTDAVITGLAEIGGLRVISRTSVLRFKNTKDPLLEIARRLGVTHVVEGTVSRVGSRLRITVQLIDASVENHLWAETYEPEFHQAFKVPGQVAQAVARQINVRLTARETSRLATAYAPKGEALQAYLRGRHHLNKLAPEATRKSIEYFETALDHDAAFAAAYAGLADAYQSLVLYEVPPKLEYLGRAKAAALKALEIDGELAEAHLSLASMLERELDWIESERHFRRAIEINPNHAMAHQWYAEYLAHMGRLEESYRQTSAAQQLDPLNLLINGALGRIACLTNRFDEGFDQLRKTLDMNPNFSTTNLFLGLCQCGQGMHIEAVAAFQACDAGRRRSGDCAGLVGYAYARAGRKEEAMSLLGELKVLRERQYVSAFAVAAIYIGLQENDPAFEWLEHAYRERSFWLWFLKTEPIFASIRPDPRFAELLKKMRLDQTPTKPPTPMFSATSGR